MYVYEEFQPKRSLRQFQTFKKSDCRDDFAYNTYVRTCDILKPFITWLNYFLPKYKRTDHGHVSLKKGALKISLKYRLKNSLIAISELRNVQRTRLRKRQKIRSEFLSQTEKVRAISIHRGSATLQCPIL